MIKLDNISYQTGNFLLKNISFDVRLGEVIALVGPSGAGKSLLLEIIAGLILPQSGVLSGIHRGEAGLIFQDQMLFFHLNLFDNIAYGLKIQKKSRKTIEKEVVAISKELSIDHLLKRSVDTLSGGEKQRAAFARALVVYPQLLLLDEPTVSLDVLLKQEFHTLLKRVHSERKQTMILVTHDFKDVQLLADRVVVLEGGTVVYTGSPDELAHSSLSRFIRAFVAVT